MKPNLTDQSLMDQSLTQGAGAVPAPRATHPLEAPLLETRSVCLRYDGDLVLRDVSMQVAEGEIYAVIGPSGCGKTSLLRVIAGLERAQAGEVWLGGECIDDVPAHRRGIGMMFQELALFPHLDVRANVAFGLRMQGLARGPRDARLDEMLALVGLSGYGDRKVYELSGGERQRVALARSLAPRPRLLLLDEPVGALDRALREQLLSELGQILRAPGLTAIYVTHDQEEAFALADRVMVMDAGRVRQIGRPQALYGAPAGAWVARFLGLTNLVPGEVEPQAPSSSPSPSPAAMGRGAGGEAPAPHAVLVHTPIGDFTVPAHADAGPVTLLLGDERAQVEPADPDTAARPLNTILGVVLSRSFQGRLLRLRVRSGEHELSFAIDAPAAQANWSTDDGVRVTLDPASIRLLPPER